MHGQQNVKIKEEGFVASLTASLEELRARIAEAVATIGADMIRRICYEIAYGWYICFVT